MARAVELRDETEVYINRCLHGDMSDASLAWAPPDLRDRAKVLERALPHVNYCVTRSGRFVKGRRFVTSSAPLVIEAQMHAWADVDMKGALRAFTAPIRVPLLPMPAAFAVELFRRHKHAIELCMPTECVRQYDNLCSFMYALVVMPHDPRNGGLIPGLDEDLRNTCEPMPC